MTSFRDLAHEVNQFLENETKFGDVSHLSSGHMEHVADEELSHSNGQLSIDNYGHTSRMKSEYARKIKDTYKHWFQKSKKLQDEIKDMRANLSSAKAQKKIDTLLAQKAEDIKQIKDKHNQGLLGQKKKIKEETESLYESMRKANNGKPPRALPIWYFLFLLVIGAGEWMINYETFAAKFAVTAMAVGMTLLVALSFAAASHFHGESLKQRSAQFGRHVDIGAKNTHRIFTIVASILFLVCYAAVIMVRYQVIQDQFSLAPNFGGVSLPGQSQAAQQSVLELLMPTVLLNLAVYLLGLVISYAVHDPIPGYQSAKRDAEKSRKEYELEKARQQQEIEQKEMAFETDIAAHRATLEQNEYEAKQLDQMAERIKEAGVVFKKSCVNLINDYLEQYRSALAMTAKKKGMEDIKVGPKDLSMTQYLDTGITVGEDYLDAY